MNTLSKERIQELSEMGCTFQSSCKKNLKKGSGIKVFSFDDVRHFFSIGTICSLFKYQ